MNTWPKQFFVGALGAMPVWVNAMTAAQSAAFRSANSGGGGLTAVEVNTFLSGLVAAVALLWFCWVVMSSFKGWGSRQASGPQAISQVLRALFMLIIIVSVVS